MRQKSLDSFMACQCVALRSQTASSANACFQEENPQILKLCNTMERWPSRFCQTTYDAYLSLSSSSLRGSKFNCEDVSPWLLQNGSPPVWSGALELTEFPLYSW